RPARAGHAETAMTPLPRHVLVVGFRRTGQALARALAARDVRVRIADDQSATALGVDPAAWRDVDLRLGETDAGLLDGVDLVVPSPGVPRTAAVLSAAVAKAVPVRSEIEVAFGLLGCPLVAITGTNGKSTTTTLVGAALAADGRRVFTGGNLGT